MLAHCSFLGAETRFNSREGAREASRSYNRCSRVSETCTHKPKSLAYLDSSNRAHTVVLRGSSRARCERGLGRGSTGGRGRNRHGFPPRATLTVACSSRQRLSAPCIRMGFCLPLASHCAVLTAPNSWAIPSSLAFDGEEGCTAVSHATVVGEKSRNAGHRQAPGSVARRPWSRSIAQTTPGKPAMAPRALLRAPPPRTPLWFVGMPAVARWRTRQ